MRLTILVVPDAEVELGADRLRAAGARAIEERAVEGDLVELRTVVADDDETSRRRVGQMPAGWSLRFAHDDGEPADTWREFAVPIRVADDLIIRPAWLDPTGDPGVMDIAIEPGGAFGLGDHPTTRVSAAATRRLVRPGSSVLDVGCGTGVLSIIAARSGAERVVAIDIAEAAREATTDNARRNGVARVIEASTRSLADIEGSFDLVVANILAPVLVAMAPDLRRLVARSGRLVFSGVLAGHYDHVVDALTPMKVVRSDVMGEWASVELHHR